MPLLAFVIVVLFPALEIFVIVEMVHWIGGAWTLLALVAGALLGVVVMRRAGASWWRALRGRTVTASGLEVAGQQPDPRAAASASLLFLAGLLIFLPGFISDAIGLILLLPPIRKLLMAATAAWFLRRFTSVTGPGGLRVWTRGDRVVWGTVVRSDRPDGSNGSGPAAGPPPALPPSTP
jgi:UPF0716 protein FxsA